MADFRELAGVTILVGDHKDETGVVVNRTGGDAWVVLTLEGDYHTYGADEMRMLAGAGDVRFMTADGKYV